VDVEGWLGSERLSALPKVTQPASVRGQVSLANGYTCYCSLKWTTPTQFTFVKCSVLCCMDREGNWEGTCKRIGEAFEFVKI
jgi:hypothetical protein